MIFSFHPEAEIELNTAIDYYEKCKIGLGLEFTNEVYTTIQRILNFPKAWQILDKDIRRCLTNKFPFGIIYYQKDNKIIILAVMQLNRKPNYWDDRI
jgi:hypothetical protein